jgi:hypothetical protein
MGLARLMVNEGHLVQLLNYTSIIWIIYSLRFMHFVIVAKLQIFNSMAQTFASLCFDLFKIFFQNLSPSPNQTIIFKI